MKQPTAYAWNVANDSPTARRCYGSPALRMLWDAADGSPAEVSDALLPSWTRFRALEIALGTGAAVADVLAHADRVGDARAARYVRRVARIVRRIHADETAAA